MINLDKGAGNIADDTRINAYRAKEREHEAFCVAASHIETDVINADRPAGQAGDQQSVDTDLAVPLARISRIIRTSFTEDLTEWIHSQQREKRSVKHNARLTPAKLIKGLCKSRTSVIILQ